MSDAAIKSGPRAGNFGRSLLALFSGLVTVVVLSLATDQLLHALQVYPPWGQAMFDPGLNLLALAYRCVYAVLGSFVAAMLAPAQPMRHALLLGLIGLLLGGLGLLASAPLRLGPLWYPVAVMLSAPPCAWLGGWLEQRARRP